MKLSVAILLTFLLILPFTACDQQASLKDIIDRALTQTSQVQSYRAIANTTTYDDSVIAIASCELEWAAPDRHHSKWIASDGSSWYELIVIGDDVYRRNSNVPQWRLNQWPTPSQHPTPGAPPTTTQHPTITPYPTPTSSPPPPPPSPPPTPPPPPTGTPTPPQYIRPNSTPTAFTVTASWLAAPTPSAGSVPPFTPPSTTTVTVSGISHVTFYSAPQWPLEKTFQPLNWLVDSERLQDEEIDGVLCSHYRAKFDSDSYADMLETRAQEEYEQTTEMSSEYYEQIRLWEVDIELWVDGDDYIRQLKAEGRSPDPNPSTGPEQWVTWLTITRYFDFNEPICIEPPEIEPE